MPPYDREAPAVNSRGWDGLHWDGCEVAILASGESLSVEQSEAVKRWRDAASSFRRVIAINTTFRRALYADVIYACDGAWWDGRDRLDAPRYADEAKATFAGELWTRDADAAKRHGLRLLKSQPGRGLERQVGVINEGSNSGYQAIGLAYQAAARVVYLLGYDMKGGHWHGEHPGMLRKNSPFPIFLRNFKRLAAEVAALPDFSVINCTPNSALRDFPMRKWQHVFIA
jgi:hypothetical protein